MNETLNHLAEQTRAYLEAHRETLDLPFLHSFPKNCCEIASLVLGYILKDAHPSIEFIVVKADRPGHGKHFWLEAEGKIFDITADQVDGISSPVFGDTFVPLPLREYEIYEKTEIGQELRNHDWSDRLQMLPEISQVVRGIA